jgi:hypothetical protein
LPWITLWPNTHINWTLFWSASFARDWRQSQASSELVW